MDIVHGSHVVFASALTERMHMHVHGMHCIRHTSEPSGAEMILTQSLITIFCYGNSFMEVVLKRFLGRFKIKGSPMIHWQRMNKSVWPLRGGKSPNALYSVRLLMPLASSYSPYSSQLSWAQASSSLVAGPSTGDRSNWQGNRRHHSRVVFRALLCAETTVISENT